MAVPAPASYATLLVDEPFTSSLLVGTVVPTPMLPVEVITKSFACCTALGAPEAGLSFAPSMLNTPCGFWVLMPI
ncbi:hypothetical protein D3C80_1817880 [compost metagenome]